MQVYLGDRWPGDRSVGRRRGLHRVPPGQYALVRVADPNPGVLVGSSSQVNLTSIFTSFFREGQIGMQTRGEGGVGVSGSVFF